MNLKHLAKTMATDIDAFCLKHFGNDFRWHLGASVMGHPCSRKIWYGFRWVKKEAFDARRLRLFDRGHREEPQFTMYLKGIGCEVSEFDTTQPIQEDGTYPQHRISGCWGHFGGSLDAIVKLPARYRYDELISVSYKTSGTGAKFDDLTRKGLLLSKPGYHIQESIYCWKMKFKVYGYIAANKNDDALFIDFQEADWKEAERQEKRAERIIFSRIPPARISENKAYFECSWCTFKNICFDNEVPPEVNCRSCKFSKPVEDKQWFCEGYNAIIPKDIIIKGCEHWQPIVGA